MEYDAQVFKMKANKKARNVWMALSLILSLSYTSDTAKGLHTLPYYAMFMAICWIHTVVYVYISSDEYAGFVQRQDVYGAMWHWYISDQYCQQCT